MFTYQQLALIDSALDGYVLNKDEYLDYLDELTYDGIHVDESEYNEIIESIYLAEDIQDMIWDELGFIEEDDDFWFDEIDPWMDDIGWDDVEAAIEQEELEDANA